MAPGLQAKLLPCVQVTVVQFPCAQHTSPTSSSRTSRLSQFHQPLLCSHGHGQQFTPARFVPSHSRRVVPGWSRGGCRGSSASRAYRGVQNLGQEPWRFSSGLQGMGMDKSCPVPTRWQSTAVNRWLRWVIRNRSVPLHQGDQPWLGALQSCSMTAGVPHVVSAHPGPSPAPSLPCVSDAHAKWGACLMAFAHHVGNAPQTRTRPAPVGEKHRRQAKGRDERVRVWVMGRGGAPGQDLPGLAGLLALGCPAVRMGWGRWPQSPAVWR